VVLVPVLCVRCLCWFVAVSSVALPIPATLWYFYFVICRCLCFVICLWFVFVFRREVVGEFLFFSLPSSIVNGTFD
jgi:hypothetical protein